MKNVFKSPKTYMLAGLLIIVITASAWQFKTKKQSHDTTASNNTTAAADTSNPGKHDIEDEYGMKGFDEGMKQLDLALKNIDFNFKGLDTTIEKTVREALAGIDFEKIGRETRDAVNKIDWQQIRSEVDNSLKEAQRELKNIDMDNMKLQIKEAMDKINSKEFKEQFDGDKLQKIINDALSNVSEGMGKVKEELQNWKDFTNGLEKDGLIDKKKGYKIEWKSDGTLYINGKKQSQEITDKYHKYYKEGGYTVSNDGDETESL